MRDEEFGLGEQALTQRHARVVHEHARGINAAGGHVRRVALRAHGWQ